MKLIVGTTSYPREGAFHAGGFIAEWRQALEQQGVSVQCMRPENTLGPNSDVVFRTVGDLLAGNGAPERFERAPFVSIKNGVTQTLLLGRTLRKHLKPRDFFVGHWLLPWGIIMPPNVKGHFYAHGSDIALLESLPFFLSTQLARRIDNNAHGITFVSAHLKERFTLCLKRKPRSKFSIIPMGVTSPSRDEMLFRDLMAFKKKHCLVVAMGRHVPIKGLDILLSAAQGIPNLCLAIGGDGPTSKELKIQAENAKLKVKFIGQYDQRQRVALLQAADIFVQPSREIGRRREGCPVTVLEAINEGTVCVLSDTAAHKALAVSHPALTLFAMNDAQSLGTQLRKTIRSAPSLRAKTPDKRYLWATIVEDHLATLNASFRECV